ncbi:class I SAM-dependent methyltransferase [uncultured Oscillibacter sp.]|uniref:class I SAM-dependent methyltransferase n=1 Tax=uncultured Oscillibacter sp. TaxID=876091 RepID=UPI0025FEDFF0|nr:class I SAM-dependent methyltransferase [uncultured Oscillibacter sp.]
MKQDSKQLSRAAFDRQAAGYDTGIQGSHARNLYPYLLQEIIHAWGDRVLDLGCGTGALLAQVLSEDPGRRVTGLDLSEKMLEQARARLGDRAELVRGDSEHLPFPDRSFDIVYCCDSFHHYPNPRTVVEEVGRVLEFGGVFLLGDCWLPLPGRLVMNPLLGLSREGDVKLYSRREIEGLLGVAFHRITWKQAGTRAYVAGGVR